MQMVHTALKGSYAGRDKVIAHYFFTNKASISPLDLNYMVSYVNNDTIKDILTAEYYSSPVPFQVEAK